MTVFVLQPLGKAKPVSDESSGLSVSGKRNDVRYTTPEGETLVISTERKGEGLYEVSTRRCEPGLRTR